nr:immunoglobulin heavy chain junction region [Mus musculus]
CARRPYGSHYHLDYW